MAFDPFGDRDTRGYLRNHLATDDADLLRRLETHAFAANLLPALAALSASRTVGYDQVLDTHRRLFSSVYPWAGQDRGTLASDIGISKSGMSDLFAHPADVHRAVEYGRTMGLDSRKMRANPREIFSAPAYAHPFLEGNGRTIMTVHADLARRAGFHIDRTKTDFIMRVSARSGGWIAIGNTTDLPRDALAGKPAAFTAARFYPDAPAAPSTQPESPGGRPGPSAGM